MPRQIKRYGNRKLYDVQASGYVSLEDLATIVRAGETVEVVDNATGEDITAQTLTQVILEAGKRGPSLLPTELLHDALRRGERALDTGLDQLRHGVDDLLQGSLGRLARVLPVGRADELQQLRTQVARLERTLTQLVAAQSPPARTCGEPRPTRRSSGGAPSCTPYREPNHDDHDRDDDRTGWPRRGDHDGLAGRTAESATRAQQTLAAQGRQALDTTLAVSHDVVRAGLGAAVVAQEESVRLYGTLVERGAEAERRGLARARELRGSLADGMGERRQALAGQIERTGETVSDRVGTLVQATVVAPLGTAMQRLGVPTRARGPRARRERRGARGPRRRADGATRAVERGLARGARRAANWPAAPAAALPAQVS
jgi:polyhydroxyalkanoate synthesis repressor PhaR